MSTLGQRYNNPFNISLPKAGYYGGSTVGAPGQGGYASFPDMQTGYAAGVQRLNDYIGGNTSYGPLTTINQLGPVYAQDPGWASAVSRLSGIPANQTLDPTNQAQMSALQSGILQQEQGGSVGQSIFNQYGGGVVPQSSAGVPDSSSGLNAGPNVSSDGTVNPTGPPSFPTATNTQNIPVGQGTPIAINLPKATTTDISNWINGVETATGSAFKGAFTAIFGDVTSWLKRGFLIILGALILIVALFMLADKKTQTTILQTAKGM